MPCSCHTRIAEERLADDCGVTIDDVANTLATKLVLWHPHAFGSLTVPSSADVNANWRGRSRGRSGRQRTEIRTCLRCSTAPFGQPALPRDSLMAMIPQARHAGARPRAGAARRPQLRGLGARAGAAGRCGHTVASEDARILR